MHKKVISLFAAAMVLAGLLVVGTISPALAQAPVAVENFHPSDDGDADNSGDAEVLSDRFDGTNTTAHLTAVTTTDADRVLWYVCPVGVGPTVDTQVELGTCGAAIATDATGLIPPGVASDEAWDAEWNIPADLDGDLVDLAALACIGTGERVEATGGLSSNCSSDVEEDVSLEDAQNNQGQTDADSQTSAAEIVSICTSDVDGVAAGDDAGFFDPCENAAYDTGDNATTVAARFRPFPHGSPIPNDGFVFRATSDPTITDLSWRLDGTSDSSQIDDTNTTGENACTIITPTVQSTLWECMVESADIGTAVDNTELRLSIFDDSDASGAGYCDTTDVGLTGAATVSDPDAADTATCIHDAHYVVSQTRTATVTTFSWQPDATDGSPAGNAGCDPGETPDTAEEETIGASATNFAVGVLCVRDQFNNPLSGANITFETTGAEPGAEIGGCAPDEVANPTGSGDLHDEHGATTTNNNRIDDCHTTTGATGEASVIVFNYSTGTSIAAVPGVQTVTGCVDRQILFSTAGGNQTNQPAGHGCADEPASSKASGTISWVALPDHMHFVVNGTGGTEPCHNGNTVRSAFIGETVELLVCTQAATGGPNHIGATTNQPGGGRITYGVGGSAGGQLQVATRFTNQPAETDANGRAIVTLVCQEEGTDAITATYRSDTDVVIGTAQTINVSCVRPGEATIRPSGTATVTQPGTTTTAPGSTTTAATTPVTPRTVSLEVSKSAVTFGREFALTGGVSSSVAACAANVPVTIRRTVVGQSAQEVVENLTTNSDGTFSVNKVGDKSAQYVASVDDTATCAGATSTPSPVNVKVKVDLKLSKLKIRRGGKVVLTGKIAPCDDNHAGTKLAFLKSTGGSMAKFSTKNLSDTCTARVAIRPRKDTAFQARYSKQDEDHEAGKSRKKAVSVRGRR